MHWVMRKVQVLPTVEEISEERFKIYPGDTRLFTMAEWDELLSRATARCKRKFRTFSKLVPARTCPEPVDRVEQAEARGLSREQMRRFNAAMWIYDHRWRKRNNGRKPVDRFVRVSLSRGQPDGYDSLEARRINRVLDQIKSEKRATKRARYLTAA